VRIELKDQVLLKRKKYFLLTVVLNIQDFLEQFQAQDIMAQQLQFK
jgi:hypothetical protein